MCPSEYAVVLLCIIFKKKNAAHEDQIQGLEFSGQSAYHQDKLLVAEFTTKNHEVVWDIMERISHFTTRQTRGFLLYSDMPITLCENYWTLIESIRDKFCPIEALTASTISFALSLTPIMVFAVGSLPSCTSSAVYTLTVTLITSNYLELSEQNAPLIRGTTFSSMTKASELQQSKCNCIGQDPTCNQTCFQKSSKTEAAVIIPFMHYILHAASVMILNTSRTGSVNLQLPLNLREIKSSSSYTAMTEARENDLESRIEREILEKSSSPSSPLLYLYPSHFFS
ncbi:hypothetical protein VNO77_23219 [Canavalia gladiata]|uniref:Uncharacterized protein n=1 Tax=Canavalia gladiata TaxID=3824 RepID=A0AAN9QF65_CANGL